MTDPARLNSLLERVADAAAPERSLFAEVFLAGLRPGWQRGTS
ncbi:MAG: hypothetical protein WAP03_05505 [Methylorubrum rhodinum]